MNRFVVGLAIAVAVHLLVFQGFLFDVPVKRFVKPQGFSFLGSILNSSQVEGGVLLRDVPRREDAAFSGYIPPRSERKSFERLKEIDKPGAGVLSDKKDLKTIFPIRRSSSSGVKRFEWIPVAPEYQPLRMPD